MKSGKFLSLILIAAILFSLATPIAFAEEALFANGAGTEENPYEIATVEDFLNIANHNSGDNSGVYYKQTAEINLGNYTPFEFNGYYDGDNNIIHLAIVANHNRSLFSKLSGTSSVSNLTVEGTVEAWSWGASIASEIVNGSEVLIENVTNNAAISGTNYIGGIIGKAELTSGSLTLRNVVNNGAVKAVSNAVGGLVASAYMATFENCKNTGNVTITTTESTEIYVGGIAGVAKADFTKCINTGNIKASTAPADRFGIGGIVGSSLASKRITNCFNTGVINGSGNVGGIIGSAGYNASGTYLISCYTTSGIPVGNILSGGSANCTSVYYFADEDTDAIDGTVALTADKRTSLENYGGFSDTVWKTDYDNTGYEYPQITGSEIYITRGTKENPHLIDSKEDFIAIGTRENNGVYYKQTKDIEIGSYTAFDFNGIYDGGGNEINITPVGANSNGLFVTLSGNAEVYDLTIEGTVYGWTYAGGVAGSVLDDSTIKITNVINNATVRSDSHGGGIIGYFNLNTTGGLVTITNSRNNGEISGYHGNSKYLGGIMGYGKAVISECVNTGNITTRKTLDGTEIYNAGGIIGGNKTSSASVNNCVNTGNISLTGNTGGIIGIAGVSSSTPQIKNSYTTTGIPVGAISANGALGGGNLYYFADEETDSFDATTALTADKRTSLNNYSGFDSAIWFVDFDKTGYEYPQIKGNEITVLWGTKENPWIIDSEEDFEKIEERTKEGVYFKQTTDLNLGNYTPFAFNGIYDGGNKTITLALAGDQHLSLFSELSGAASVSNLTIEGSVYGWTRAAAIANNVAADSTITISNIINNAKIKSDNHSGGIVCYADFVNGTLTITKCVNNGDIIVNNDGKYAGGIIAYGKAMISECVNTGNIITSKTEGVTVAGAAGGIMGGNKTSSAKIDNCYNTGKISVSGNVGGLIGMAGLSSSGPYVQYSYTSTGVPVGAVDPSGSVNITNVYYFAEEETDALELTTALSADKRTTLANYGGFSSDKWMVDYDTTGYKYPQLKSCVLNYEFGSKENPYEISDEQSFVDMETKLGEGKYFVITKDIVLSSSYVPYAFTNGYLDGGNNTVTFTIEKTEDCAGLFTQISGTSTIENLILDGSVSGTNYVGALAGRITEPEEVVIKNCVNKADVTASGARTGGFIGDLYNDSKINNLTVNLSYLTNEGTVSGNGYWVGGITGLTANGVVLSNMINKGNITGGNSAGGIVGLLYGDVIMSYNTGVITAPCSGGIAGYTLGSALIDSCFNMGKIIMTEDAEGGKNSGAGGILGDLGGVESVVRNCYDAGTLAKADKAIASEFDEENPGTIENCFYLSPAGIQGKSGTLPKTKDELKAVDLGENFVISENAYPQLKDMPAVAPHTLYVLTVSVGENGEADAETRYVKAGESVTVTAIGAQGYEASEVYVNNTPVEHIEGVYTISDINADTTYHADFVKAVVLTVTASVLNGSELANSDYLIYNIGSKYIGKPSALIYVKVDGLYKECGFTVKNNAGSYNKTFKTESNEVVMIVSDTDDICTITPYVIDASGTTYYGTQETVILSAEE